jgi:hypothetical protein
MAVGLRSSSSMWSSLRSISSRRRRISKRRSLEAMDSPERRKDKAPATTSGEGLSWQSRLNSASSLCGGGRRCSFFASHTSPSGRYRLDRSDPVRTFVRLRRRFAHRSHEPSFSRNGRLWNTSRDHSGLMLAARITLPHFSVSSATSFPNSAGVIGMGSPASSARRVCNFGSANTAFTA